MAEGFLVRTAALASLLIAVSATAGCVSSIDSSSHMFGGGLRSPHNSAWVAYTQETQWKNKGDITKINLYYDVQTKCLRGVKPTFGYNSADASRIGVEGAPAGTYSEVDLKLTPSVQNTEQVIKADYKFSDTCVEYLKLYTNRNRVVAVGNSDSSSPLLTTWPVAPNGYLGFFKGWTDVANTGAQVGQLTQLQLVWVVRTCNDTSSTASYPNPSGPPSNPNPSGPPSYPNPSNPPSTPNPSAPPPGYNPPVPPMNPPVPSTPPSTPPPPVIVVPKCTPAAILGCNAGKCPASTCPLTGLGLKVPILCYGVNKEFVPLQNYLHPCTNLACQLDKPGCQSFGVLGIGSYCTGTVVAMADSTQLHPIAKLLVGFPCIEHTGALLDVVPALSTAQNKGVYMAKAWKTCDCMQGGATIIQAMISKNVSLSAALDIKVGEMGALLTKVFNVSLPNCNIEDMLKQWVSAIAIKLPLPKLVVPDLKVLALGAVIPGFKLPCLVLPDISVPLLKTPLALKALPIFHIHASKVIAIAKLLELTTLPTLLLPSSGATDVAATAQSLTLPDFSIDGLKALAATFVANATQDIGLNGLKTLLSLDKMANISMLLQPNVAVTNLDLPTMIGQWAAANTLNISLPTLSLGEMKITALKVLIPGFKLPCMIVHHAAAAFVLASKDLPLFIVSESAIKGVSQLLPGLTSLATVLVDKNVQTAVPTIKIGQVTIPDFTKLALQLSASILPNVTIPGLPAIPSLLNIQSVNLNGLANFFSNMEKTFKAITAGGSATVKQLESTLGEVASAIIPNNVEAALANFTANAATAMQQLQSTLGQAVSAVLPDSVEAMFSAVNGTNPDNS